MRLLALAYALIAVPALLACLAAYAAWSWRYERSRFLLAGAGALGAAGAAGLLGVILSGAGVAAGASAWLAIPPAAVLPALLLALLKALRQRDAATRRMAADASANQVTGLPNRPLLVTLMRPVLARCRREKAPASILAFSGDGLAEIEAQRGRAAAEDVLRDMGAALRESVRAADVPGHLGPTVLGVLLSGTPAESARVLAARLGSAVNARIVHPDMDGRRLSVSIGIASVGDGEGGAVIEEALAAAEAARMAAEAAGGNAVHLAPPPPPRSASA